MDPKKPKSCLSLTTKTIKKTPSTPSKSAWNANSIASLTPSARAEFIASLTRNELIALFDDWSFWARKEQLAPKGDWHSWLFLGGRGAGKTRAGAEWLRGLAQKGKRFALIGPSLHDVREVMIDGPSGLRHIGPKELRPKFEVSRRRLVWPKGGVAYAFSAEDPESLRGPQFHSAWADEYCAWPKPAETLALLRMGVRLGERPQVFITTTPKPLKDLTDLMKEQGCVMSRAASFDNRAFLAEGFLSQLETLYGGTPFAAQELMGDILNTEHDALFQQKWLSEAYTLRPEIFDRLIVAIDPSIGAGGDACGLVVAGRLGGLVYILEDATLAGVTPLGWAKKAVFLCETYQAHVIIAEANQGGEMIRALLASAGAEVKIELVHARLSKTARAEPVAALYAQGRVKHAPSSPHQRFVALEEELLSLSRSSAPSKSPNRADALVWAVTHLMPSVKPEPRLSRL